MSFSMNLNQITIPVKDVEASIQFYQKLGLRLIVKSLPHYARFQCPEGDSTFSLHMVDELPTSNGIWIYFEVQDLDIHVQMLIDKGIVFEELPTNKTWLWREAKLKDIDNNPLILYYAGSNRLNPPWRIQD
ncbi:MAG: Glyoxalase family protein [Flavisolibacter sp.]|nr:Glyoxalase family protein [Flavisolibacter sp.]